MVSFASNQRKVPLLIILIEREALMGKRIVLCADGTWNTPHGLTAQANDTNVRKLFCSLADLPEQLRFYDSGVGTDGTPIDHLTGGAMGEGLFHKIQENYQFLAHVWDPSDDIYLFGFSRGAYTARSLGGMLARFGVPTKNFDNMMVRNIFTAYRQTDPAQRASLQEHLNQQYGMQDVSIRMIGVWDTVGSLGIPGLLFSIFDQKRYGFLDTSLHKCIQKAYHAVSIDEKRAQFMPTLWTELDQSERPNDEQLQQVWFPGCHCDVGGSYTEEKLSDVTLSWMMQKAILCGLTFTEAAKQQYLRLDPENALGPAHDEWKLVPWGIPSHRKVPAGAVMASTVQSRLAKMPEYKPGNLTTSDRQLVGYGLETVLPEA
ncbi:MAG: DUF2235 domain-containing protein [Acidobacteriaceae bacterium]